MGGVVIVCAVALFAAGDGQAPPDTFSETVRQSDAAASEAPASSQAAPVTVASADSTPPASSEATANAPVSADAGSESTSPSAPADQPPPDESQTAASQPAANTEAAATPQTPAATPTSGRPLDDVRARKNILPIAGTADDAVPLCTIGVTNAKHCDLKLAEAQFNDPQGTALKLTRRDEGTSSFWDATQETTSGLGRTVKTGTFELASGQLSFTWESLADRSFLPFCRLEVSADEDGVKESETCRLWTPLQGRPAKMTFEASSIELELIPEDTPLPPAECLALAVELDNFAHVDSPVNMLLTPGSPSEVVMVDPDDSLVQLFSTSVEFVVEAKRGLLKMQHTAVIPEVRVRRGQTEVEDKVQPFSTKGLDRLKASVEKQQERTDKQIKELTTKITRLDARSGSSSGRQLEVLNNSRAALEDALVKLAELPAWVDSTRDVCSDTQANGRIKLKLYRRVDGGNDVDILVME